MASEFVWTSGIEIAEAFPTAAAVRKEIDHLSVGASNIEFEVFQHFAHHRASQASCRDVGEAIPSVSLRPHADRASNLGRPIPVCPSCGGHAPTAERTMTRQMPDTQEAYRIV